MDGVAPILNTNTARTVSVSGGAAMVRAKLLPLSEMVFLMYFAIHILSSNVKFPLQTTRNNSPRQAQSDKHSKPRQQLQAAQPSCELSADTALYWIVHHVPSDPKANP